MTDAFTKLTQKLQRIAGATVREDIRFPSGAAEVVVAVAGCAFAIRYVPRHNVYEVYNVDEQVFDSGPAEHFDTFGPAADRLLALVRGAANAAKPRLAAS